MGYAERRRPASLEKISIGRVHAPLKRQRMLQRVLTENHAGLLVDTNEQMLDSLFRNLAGKGPSSPIRQHFSAAIIVRYPAVANSSVHFPAVAKPD